MPYATIVAGTTITASWANANVRDQTIVPFASASARSSAITSPIEGMLSYRTDSKIFEGYDGTQWWQIPYSLLLTKASDQQVVSSTTYTDITGFSFSALASSTYQVEADLFYSAGTTGDFRPGWVLPAGATVLYAAHGNPGSSASTPATVFYGAFTATTGVIGGGTGVGAKMYLGLRASVSIAGTAGTVKLQMAQDASDATATVLYAGSFLKITKV